MRLVKWIVAGALAAAFQDGAFADAWRDGSAYIECLPEKGFFELRTKQTYFPQSEAETEALQARGIYFPEQLQSTPLRCALEGYEITVGGFDGVDGKGACGARAGSRARVSINGIPVVFKFYPATRLNSSQGLMEGWIELSDCFEYEHSVTIQTDSMSGNWLQVQLCRVEPVEADRKEKGLTTLSGACKSWFYSSNKETPYHHAEAPD